MTQEYRSGFAAVVGRTNAGKSTLINALLGEKVAIVSPRVQTTRNRILGVLHRPGAQLVFVDTPGLHQSRNRLSDYMMRQAYGSLEGADAAVLLVDATRGWGEWEDDIAERLQKSKLPLICAVNKTDLVTKDALADVLCLIPDIFQEIFPISAANGDQLPALCDALFALLPEGPQYFPDDMVTDQPLRRMAAELIREQALLLLRDELPHGVGVSVAKIEEPAADAERPITRINADLFVERQSHKGMVIGKGGAMLKSIGTTARPALENLFGTQVYLELYVKVVSDWRNKPSVLRDLEYNE